MKQCDYCKRYDNLLRKVKMVDYDMYGDSSTPFFTDDNGNPLTTIPYRNYCSRCIKEIQENPIMFNVKLV